MNERYFELDTGFRFESLIEIWCPYFLIRGVATMEQVLIKNDLAKIVFLENNTILWQVDNNRGKIILSIDVYNILLGVYKSGDIIIADKIELEIFDEIIQKRILLKAGDSFLQYRGTKFEKTNYYFFDILGANKALNRLKQVKLLLVGVGGIGIEIINHLLAVGINKFTLVDYDNVETTNFNRQYAYNIIDIGLPKLDVIKKYILAKDSSAKIDMFNCAITNKKQLLSIVRNVKNIDLIICAADTPACTIQKVIAEVSLAEKIPVFYCGGGIYEGTVGPLLVSSKKKRDYIERYSSFFSSKARIYPTNGSLGATNSIIAGYAAKDLIFFLSGYEERIKCLEESYTIKLE